MAFSVTITLTTAGADTGPFDLYSDVDGYTAAFETGVLKVDLVAGYTSPLVPNGTSIIRVKSTAVCTNYVDLPIAGVTTTTTTTATPVPTNVIISACAVVHPDISGFVSMYVYSTASVLTNVTVQVRWTGSVGTIIDQNLTITTGNSCQSASAGTATLGENGINLQIMSISPSSFDTQTYIAGSATLNDTCVDCGIL
jgi:hypothetical protein